jgi:hypothetical protein
VGADSGGTVRHGTAGNVQVYIRSGGSERTPSLMKYHPEIADPPDQPPDAAGCGELMASVPQILFANLCAASCMLSTWWLHACGELEYCELVFDIRQGRTAPLIPMPGVPTPVPARTKALSPRGERDMARGDPP